MRLADVAELGRLFCRWMLRVAGAEVSVRQSADPSAGKVGEAALAGARCAEVDTYVVEVESLILLRGRIHGSPSPSHRGRW
jgi:hypothetical protein